MNKYKKLAKNTVVLSLGVFGSKILSFLLFPFYTHLMSTDDYGAVTVIINASTLIMAVATLSMGEAIIRFTLDKDYNPKKVFSIAATTVAAGLCCFAFVMPFIGKISTISNYTLLIYIYVITGSFKSICGLYVRSRGLVRLFAIDGVFTTITMILFQVLFLAVFKLSVFGYILAVILSDLLSVLFLSYMGNLRKHYSIRSFDFRLFSSMIKYSIPLIPTGVMWWVTSVSDSFFVSEMISLDANGIYSAAYKLPSVISLISGVFSQAWQMSAITEKNSRTIANFYSNVFNMYQSIIYMAAAGIFLVIKPVLLFATASAYHDAYRYTPFLILSVVFSCFGTFMGTVYIAAKESARSMVTTSIGAILNIILNFILIPVIGIQGAAIATVSSYLTVFIVRTIDTRSMVRIRIRMYKMCFNIILLLLMGFTLIIEPPYSELVLCVLFLLICVGNLSDVLKGVRVIIKKKNV